MAPDRIYPDSASFPTAPPPPGTYYDKDQAGIPPPATYRQRRRGRSPCCCCMLHLCIIFTTLVVLIGLAVLIFWLVVQPKGPRFDVNVVHIDGLSGSPPYNTNITYELKVYNPNKDMGFYYSDIFVNVQADGTPIGNKTVDGFYQGHKNTTYLSGEIEAIGVNPSAATLNAVLTNGSHVPFYAQVDFKVKIKVGAIKTWKIKAKVECNLFMDLVDNLAGSQLTGSSCKVKL
jgi:hypothetical protein